MINLILQIIIGLLLADLISGIIHWAQDKYGNPDWPIVGPIFADVQMHHEKPLKFLDNSFLKRNGVTAIVSITLFSILVGLFGFHLFLLVAALIGAFANEIHAYAHRKDNPKWVTYLQRFGILLSPMSHAKHHKDFNQNYFAITSWLNWLWTKTIKK